MTTSPPPSPSSKPHPLGGIFLLLLLLLGSPPLTSAEDTEDVSREVDKRTYETLRIAGDPPHIDGRLDETVWETVEWSGEFLERDPSEGGPPSEQTRFKVVYDNDALYFAFRMEDDPDLVSRQLARRDVFPGDWIEVNIDSYFDHRTAFSFTLSCSGTRGDELISNDGNHWDSSWNPVWNGAAQLHPQGWTAEMRIPLSQLRFSAAAEQVWGLQVTRRIHRLEERSTWQRIPKNLSGWVSNFGELRGLRDLAPKRTIEFLPYAVASAASFEAEPGNPFRDGSSSEIDGGIDGKVGLTNNLTVDFTINPDFGQVEADPSQVNLTAFEVFFDEQRPFFIEGRDIFDLRVAPAQTGGPFTADRLFYSRRIGRQPVLHPDAPTGAFVDPPQNSTILGAFKLSGKTAGGLSIGILESVTAEEKASLDLGGERSRQAVEPLTNYFVGRLRQDFHGGDTQIGGIFTAVNRKIDEGELADNGGGLRRAAYAGGLDLSHYFHERDYRLEASVFASSLRGSQRSILEAQESSARFYQRPDNDYVTLDPTRTSLSGHAGSVRLSRTSNHQLVFQTGMAWRSPGFELNDLGFLRAADGINQFTWVAYQRRNPFSIFDRLNINGNQRFDWDYGGNFLGSEWNTNANAQFRNKFGGRLSLTRVEERTSNTELRGGPSSKWPGSWSYEGGFNTDRRKKISADLGFFVERGDENSSATEEGRASITWRPSDALLLSLQATTTESEREMQYIGTEDFAGDARFLFGTIEQETTVLTLRLNYSITPDLTVQLYAAPFVSTGRYREFKRITTPQANAYRDRFRTFDGGQIARDPAADLFRIDEDRDGAFDYDISNPDFDVREFNSNLVLRWEYQPGSAIFLVWSQVRDEPNLLGRNHDFRNDLDQLFSAPAHNVWLLKVSKWFSP